MVQFMMDNGLMIKDMVMVNKFIKMGMFMRDNGFVTSKMEWVK